MGRVQESALVSVLKEQGTGHGGESASGLRGVLRGARRGAEASTLPLPPPPPTAACLAANSLLSSF